MIITRIIHKISQARRNMPTCAYYRQPSLHQETSPVYLKEAIYSVSMPPHDH